MGFEPKTVTIYSVGLLGGSLGLALKQARFPGKVLGLSSPLSITTALARGCIDEGFGYNDLPAVLARTDLLFLCSPIGAILETIARLSACALPEGIVISDIGSTKQQIVAAAASLPKEALFIGGHPMTGSEKNGCAYSDPYLFQNAIYVLTAAGAPSGRAEDFAGFLDKYLGCRHCFLSPALHDTVVAMVSHLPHLAAVALVNCSAELELAVPGTLTLAAGGFRDMTRIASAPYELWHDILATNKPAIIAMLEKYTQMLVAFKELLDKEGLGPNFNAAAQTRRRMPFSNKGFIRPISEILVQAPDKPGVIAQIATSLGRENINIKDIEVVKVREGEGGTIRLAFDNETIAARAIALLQACGFSAWERK
ncbi:MAG: prephenate dehydrogenase/arogenate dehydrogenase family protein [Chitinivibrionales bacterium]|nr:prephenate dehydrogenase/arogenate dehydrogenase family protein [Chitinivibrionales bacterium]